MTSVVAGLRQMAHGRLWPLMVLCLAAWTFLIMRGNDTVFPTICVTGDRWKLLGYSDLWTARLGMIPELFVSWVMMLVAMMAPTLGRPLAHVVDRSLRERRGRATLLFLVGYVVIWVVCMIFLSLLSTVALAWPRPVAPFAGAIGLALAWQGSSIKQRMLNQGHALPSLPVFGIAAELGSIAFGIRTGLLCAGSCWALMLLPLVAPDFHLLLMAAVFLIILEERFACPRPTRVRITLVVPGFGLLAVAAVALIL